MSEPLITFLIALLLILLGLVIRFRPFWINPNLGADHWYWLLCAEDVKRRRKLPPRLPYFMLEIEEQWYPPLFAGLLALVPMKWLKDHGGKISQLVDLLQGLFIFLTVFWISNSLGIAFLSGLSYFLAWLPMSYSTQLQPRGLANLLLTLAMIGLWFYINTGNLVIWVGLLILSVILLFLHKMTVQMWVVYLFGFGIWALDWKVLILLPASVLFALIVSKGFYIKMLQAHWDIVSFWHENIKHFGKHQYYDSPRYYKEDALPNDWWRTSFGRMLTRVLQIADNNVFALLIPILAYYAVHHPEGRLANFLWIWLGITYLWALLTTLFRYFVALGAGHYYVYQSFFPLFLLVGLSTRFMPTPVQFWLFAFWAIGLVYSVIKWERYCRSIPTHTTGAIGNDQKEVLDYLKTLPKDGVFCIPFYSPDAIPYWTRKKVFWGGHSYGFHTMLKPYFPLMREEIKQTLKKESLNYLLFWRGYLRSLSDIGLREGEDIHYLFGKGDYELYEVIK
jgi:hypothetical protein